jgi:hypothetical protein
MLTRFDDYPIHQTPAPVAEPLSGDRNVYDRYWFNGFAAESDAGPFYFGIGAALYPNAGIMDCGFSIVRAGEQHAFHGSRRAPHEPTDVTVGPFRIDVIEPMRRIAVILDDNETGISAELTFTAETAAVEEGRQTIRRGPRLLMDVTRFAQFGHWDGEIRYGGETVAITAVHGVKDRSWGVRPIGSPDPGIAPPEQQSYQTFFAWAPLFWDDHCTHFGVFENASGMWHFDGAVVPRYRSVAEIPEGEDTGIERVAAIEHHLTYVPGTRRAGPSQIVLVHNDGVRREIDLEPLVCFRMKGIGYSHPTWGHGMWKGDLAIAGESWRVDEVEPMAVENQHIQQVVRARCDGREGVGVLEQICFGPHPRYGFKDMLDPA